MPRLKIAFLVLSFFFAFFCEVSAQNVIVYDFKTGAFSAPIPYDEIVTFKLIHIPEMPETISFECFEKGKLNDDSSGVSVLKRIIKKAEIRPDSSVAFVSTTYFKPNRDYIFTILAEMNPRSLNEQEKQKLLAAFQQDQIIPKAMSEVHQRTITDSAGVDYLVELQKILDAQSLAIAKQTLGSEVKFNSPLESRIKLANQVGDYSSNLINLLEQINTLNDLVSKNLPSTTSAKSKKVLLNNLNDLKKFIVDFSEWPKSKESTDLIAEQIAKLTKMSSDSNLTSLTAYLTPLSTKWAAFLTSANTLKNDFAANKVLEAIVSDMQLAQVSNPSYPKALKEQASGYFAIDFGMGYIPNTDQFVTFTQASFYFRPIKRNVPLRMYAGWDQVLARLSVDFGLTLNSIAKEDEMRGFSFDKSKDASNALMIGLGVRVLSFAKVNAGTMIYQRKALGAPETDYSYTGSFYIGVSIDLSLKGVVSENFGPKTPSASE